MKIFGFILLMVGCCESAKILALLSVVSPSHHIFNRGLIRALASRGHQLTVLSPDKDEVTGNTTYLHIEGMYKKTEAEIDFEEFVEVSAISMMFTALEWATTLCELSLESTAAQQLMKSTEKFDLIITEATFTECLFGFIPKFGSPPVVALSAFGIPPWLIDLMGTPENPSYTPNSILPYTDHMTFFQRVHNTLITTILNINYRYSIIPHSEEVARKHFKTEQPSYVDVVKNFSFLLTNLVFGLDAARPLAPNVIPISGMHIKSKPDPLPEEIRKFLDGAKDGFIFFSLGTNVKSKALPKEKLRALLDAFAELPQRILWKFESDDLPGLPPNVMIGKWLPQSDILAHPNIRAFISHCGKVSTTESIYRGVPVVGVPFFADQWLNLQQMLAKGVAVNLDFVTLTKESTLTSIREILNNESYNLNMKKLSAISKDHPQSAIDRAVFWTEYAIRHGGAPHLRPASTDLYWYQYLLLDVLSFFAAGVFLIAFVIYFILKTVLKLLKGKSNIKSKQS